MNSEFACLIPFTRNCVSNAVKSADDDGWKTLALSGKEWGVHKTREALLNRAFADPEVKFIRYLDDDDILLPHLAEVKTAFKNPEIDLVYLDYRLNLPSKNQISVSYKGDPLQDCMQIHPWSWVARKEVLFEVKRIYGWLWDYDRPCREGGFTWLKFLNSSLRMQHLSMEAYQWNKSFSPNCISQHPAFREESDRLYAKIQEVYTQSLKLQS
jgi:hypothetical protein